MKRHILLLLALLTSAMTWAQNVNGDNKVDYNDVTELSNYLMGKPSTNFDVSKADVNGDTKINVADIVALINLAMADYDSQSLVVWKSDGTRDYIPIIDQPETSFDGYSHIIKTKSETKVYGKEDVLRYSFSRRDKASDPKPTANDNIREAFYVYQNDGHFDGFFYDEIQKMTFSNVDTLGVTHESIVSQEIATADSTYRIMLTAIDSIGFVQPDIKYNPHVYIKDQTPVVGDFFDLLGYMDYEEEGEFIFFSKYWDEFGFLPLPQVGDVFVDPDMKYGWSAKIDKLTRNHPGYEGQLVAICKPIEDITEIFQQFVTVEEYGYDDEGTMVSRRVAGRPELSVGVFSKKSSTRAEGQWEGDLFNFSMNSNFPLYVSDNLNVNAITAIDGKLHVKTTWNLSLFGDKYINILARLNFGVAGGFSIDGSINKTLDTGLGELGSIPVPAACPILCITIGPDVFLRAEAHVNFTAMTPKTKGSVWTQLEIKNWIPRFDMGFGTPKGEDEVEEREDYSAKLSLNGFVQAGLQFPLTFGSLPTFKKFFNFSAGSKVYLGPKLAADFTIDLKKYEWDSSVMGEWQPEKYIALQKGMYTTLLNTTLQLHMLDVDFDVKSKMDTGFTGVKEATLFSGSASLLPALDMSFVPKFGPCEEYTEDKYIESDFYGNQVLKCRVLAFKPSGLVIRPVKIGALVLSRIKDDGTEDNVETEMTGYTFDNKFTDFQKYYNVTEVLGQELPKEKWAHLFIPYREGRNYNRLNGKFKVCPAVLIYGRQAIGAEEYVFEHGAILHVNAQSRHEGGNTYTDELYLNADGTPSEKPFEITGNCDSLAYYSDLNSWIRNDDEGWNLSRRMNELQIVGNDGNFTIEKNPDKFENSYNPCDTIQAFYAPYGGVKTIEGEIFESFVTEKHQLYVYKLPNKKDPKTCNISLLNADFSDAPMTVTKHESGRGWHFSVKSSRGEYTLVAEFEILYPGKDYGLDDQPGIIEHRNPRLRISSLVIYEKQSDTFSRKYTLATPGFYRINEVQEGFASDDFGASIPFNITQTEILRDGKTLITESSRNIPMYYKISF